MSTMRFVSHLAICVLLVAVLGCATASVDRTAAQADAGAPVSAQVQVLNVPYDAALPKFVVAVEPLEYSASGQISGGGQGAPVGGDIGAGLAAQLQTALSHWGNIAMVERDAVTRNNDGTYTCKLQEGEVGPFIIKGTVTEFMETADASGKTRGGGLGRAGLATGLVGAITGNSDVAAVGAGVAIANPNVQKGDMRRKGMVGMDLQLVDGRSARIVRGYNCAGTFETISSVSGASVFGIGGTNTEFAASALGQATRAAMNDALTQTADALKTVR